MTADESIDMGSYDIAAYIKHEEDARRKARLRELKAREYDTEGVTWYTDNDKIAILPTIRARLKYRTRHITAPVRFVATIPSKYRLSY